MKTDEGFIDAEDDFDWLSDDFDLDGEIRKLRQEGYEIAPNDYLPDEEFYDYAFLGPLLFCKPIQVVNERGMTGELSDVGTKTIMTPLCNPKNDSNFGGTGRCIHKTPFKDRWNLI